jgi:hypothetical protein
MNTPLAHIDDKALSISMPSVRTGACTSPVQTISRTCAAVGPFVGCASRAACQRACSTSGRSRTGANSRATLSVVGAGSDFAANWRQTSAALISRSPRSRPKFQTVDEARDQLGFKPRGGAADQLPQ